MSMVRMALVGCNKLGGNRASCKVEGLEFTVAMDIVSERARAIAETTGGRATTDFRAVIEADDVDAVYIATPHALHAEQAIAAAEHGKHVLVEKPLATNREDAMEVVRACRANDVRLGVGYQNRFLSGARELRDMVCNQRLLGDLYYVRHAEYRWVQAHPRWTETWRAEPALAGGGLLFDSGTHCIDLMRFITGLDPDEVFCRRGWFRSPPGIEDVASVYVTYRGARTIGQLDALASAAGGERIKINGQLFASPGMDLYGTEGHILWAGFTHVYLKHGAKGIPPGTWTRLPYEPAQQDTLMLNDFVGAIREGRDPLAAGSDGVATVDFVLSAYESSRRNEPVKLENRHLTSEVGDRGV